MSILLRDYPKGEILDGGSFASIKNFKDEQLAEKLAKITAFLENLYAEEDEEVPVDNGGEE